MIATWKCLKSHTYKWRWYRNFLFNSKKLNNYWMGASIIGRFNPTDWQSGSEFEHTGTRIQSIGLQSKVIQLVIWSNKISILCKFVCLNRITMKLASPTQPNFNMRMISLCTRRHWIRSPGTPACIQWIISTGYSRYTRCITQIRLRMQLQIHMFNCWKKSERLSANKLPASSAIWTGFFSIRRLKAPNDRKQKVALDNQCVCVCVC